MSIGHTVVFCIGAETDAIKCETWMDAKQTILACNGLLLTESEGHFLHSDSMGSMGLLWWGISLYVPEMIVERLVFRDMHTIKLRKCLRDYSLEYKAWLRRLAGTSIKLLHTDQEWDDTALQENYSKGKDCEHLFYCVRIRV